MHHFVLTAGRSATVILNAYQPVSLRPTSLEAPLIIGDGVDLGGYLMSHATGLDRLRIVGAGLRWSICRPRQVIAYEIESVRRADSIRLLEALGARYRRPFHTSSIHRAGKSITALSRAQSLPPHNHRGRHGKIQPHQPRLVFD